MKRYCLIKDGKMTQIGALPVNFDNVSNFYLLSDDEIKQYGWLPVETISEEKEIKESIEYIIEENVVKEIITTRNKTQEEIDIENKHQIEAKWCSIRLKRNKLLKESDVQILPDKWENMDLSMKSAWTLYRQQLRDIPQAFSNPDRVIWANKP